MIGKPKKSIEEDFMKTLKLISLILAIVIIGAALSSCGILNMFFSLENVYNKDYNPIEAPFTTSENLSLKPGSVFVDGNSYFAVFKDAEAGYNVYSFATNSFVYSAYSSPTRGYEIDIFNNIPAFVVKEMTLSADTSTIIDVDPKCTMYDINGNSVVSYNEKVEDPVKIADMYIYNYVAYTEAEDGTLSEKMNVPEYLMINGMTKYNDKYIYSINDEGVVVYSLNFEVVSFWNAPGYVDDIEFFVLNNGDILAQYTVLLDSMEEKYDFMHEAELGSMNKYDLVSLVIKAKSGNDRKVNLDYIVESVINNSTLYDETDTNNIFTDKFENIASISYITDGRIDSSSVNDDIVLLGNNGKVKTSLKVTPAQLASAPVLVAEGVYAAPTTYGMALIDKKGKVIQAINNTSVSMKGNYIITDKAIYNLDMEVVYSLKENDAEVIGSLGNTLFIEVENDTGSSIMAFRDGSTDVICTKTADNGVSFKIKEEMGCYEVSNSSGEYKYYNAECTFITASTNSITVLAVAEDGNAILVSDGAATPNYSIIRK